MRILQRRIWPSFPLPHIQPPYAMQRALPPFFSCFNHDKPNAIADSATLADEGLFFFLAVGRMLSEARQTRPAKLCCFEGVKYKLPSETQPAIRVLLLSAEALLQVPFVQLARFRHARECACTSCFASERLAPRQPRKCQVAWVFFFSCLVSGAASTGGSWRRFSGVEPQSHVDGDAKRPTGCLFAFACGNPQPCPVSNLHMHEMAWRPGNGRIRGGGRPKRQLGPLLYGLAGRPRLVGGRRRNGRR